MKERPILFSAPMVRAVLAGTKTQTRRIVKAEHHYIGGRDDNHDDPALWGFGDIDGCWHVLDQSKPAWTGEGQPHESYAITCHFGQPGARLWVRETFYCDHCEYPGGPVEEMRGMLDCRADHDCAHWEAGCPCNDENGRSSWRPSIHMPRWASRITLEVTGVRVERLQDINEDDAKAEGVQSAPFCKSGRAAGFEHVESFEDLWDSLNADRAPWASNPWVWVISFQRVHP